MKRFVFGLLLILAFANFVTPPDFTKGLLLYWSFNQKSQAPSFFKSHIDMRGYFGGSLHLNGSPFHVKLEEKVRIKKRFSINFWFKPSDINYEKPIVSFLADNGTVAEFGMGENTIYCTLNGHKVVHYPDLIFEEDWSLVSLSFDGQAFHLTLFSSSVTSTTHFAVSSFKTPFNFTELQLSPKSSGFHGYIDEIMVYDHEINSADLDQLYSGKLPDEKHINQPLAVISKPVEAIEKPTSDEPVVIAEEIVGKKRLILEVKNWDKLAHNCNVTLNNKAIFSNNELTGVTLLALEANQSNALSFNLQNEALPKKVKARILSGTSELGTFDFTLTPSVKKVISLTHRSDDQPITEVQKTMVVSQRTLTIEVWDDKLTDGDFVSVFCNDEKIIDYEEISKEKIIVSLQIDPKKNNLISFVAEDSGRYGNNSAKVRILENGRVVDEFRFTSTYRKKAGLLIRVQDKK